MNDWPPDHLIDASDPESLLSRWRAELDKAEDAWHRRYGADDENELFRSIAEAFRPSVRSLEIDRSLIEAIRGFEDEIGSFGEGRALSDVVRSLSTHPIIRERVELRYAHDVINRLQTIGTRLDDVLQLMTERKLSRRADEYLARATELYLLGFEQETVVVCASSLEAAYQVVFTDDRMKKLRLFKKKSQDDKKELSYDAVTYIRAAVKARFFDRSQEDLAHRIRRARNLDVHGSADGERRANYEPQLTSKAALTATAELLDRLFAVAADV